MDDRDRLVVVGLAPGAERHRVKTLRVAWYGRVRTGACDCGGFGMKYGRTEYVIDLVAVSPSLSVAVTVYLNVPIRLVSTVFAPVQLARPGPPSSAHAYRGVTT